MKSIVFRGLVVVAACVAGPAPGFRVAGQSTPAVQMIADEGEAARYWARWRGPSGQGVVSTGGYTDTWSGTENVRWKTPIAGDGNSSPVVWGDRIFLTTSQENGTRLSLLALRRSDGARMWEAVAPSGTGERAHAKNGHASATPTTDGQRIYVSFGSRGLFAFDMDGKLVWQRDLGRIENYHGPAGSPLLYKGRVIVYQDQRPAGFIAAFDARTGEPVWRTTREA